ncbi:MAG TPA: hypothetical protein VFH73_01065, partial [Polyangia bacterium]|nr:hypothetical protein [Polyangia bacterium]
MPRRFPKKTVPVTLAVACLIAAGCTAGSIGDPGVPAGGTPAAPNGNPPAGPGGTGPVGPTTQPIASLHKLTSVEFTNSLHDLLGSNVPVATQLEPDQQL